jgi:hypothetical protein
MAGMRSPDMAKDNSTVTLPVSPTALIIRSQEPLLERPPASLGPRRAAAGGVLRVALPRRAVRERELHGARPRHVPPRGQVPRAPSGARFGWPPAVEPVLLRGPALRGQPAERPLPSRHRPLPVAPFRMGLPAPGDPSPPGRGPGSVPPPAVHGQASLGGGLRGARLGPRRLRAVGHQPAAHAAGDQHPPRGTGLRVPGRARGDAAGRGRSRPPLRARGPGRRARDAPRDPSPLDPGAG